jgi:protein involved in polysaccharide export with SLBB domain
MRPIPRSILALALASVAAAVVAQETINKNDLPDPHSSLNQAPVSVGDVPLGTSAGRTRINNGLSGSTDSGSRPQAQTGRDAVLVPANIVAQRPQVNSEFQSFVQESIGRSLPVYGAEFFSNAPSTFAPLQNVPVPAEYMLGSGDEVLIRGWGTIDIDFKATIDRNGVVNIPTIGPVVLGGVKAGDAEGVVRAAVSRLYKGVNLSVSFGQLRSITIYVVGQASRPGTYTVSSLSTLVTGLFASGGPNSNGSMRRIQVKRAGKVAGELDLYAFIAKGDKSGDIKLQDGDTIYIPAALGHVALTGKVNTPAIYELRTAKDTIDSLLEVAGGLPVVADPRRAYLERLDPAKNQPRSVEQFALDASGIKRTLKNGDVLNILSITPEFSNAVVLRGNVDQPIRAPFQKGMRIKDLIPSRDYLISRVSTQKQNSVLASGNAVDEQTVAARVGSMIDEINWDYAVVERVNREEQSINLIPFNLRRVFDDPAGTDNVELQAGDTVTIFSKRDVTVPVSKQRIFVRVEGEVNVPGVYQMSPEDTLQSLLAKAGGPTNNAYLFGTAFYREQVKKEQELNQEKVARQLEEQLRTEQSRTLANSRASTAADVQVSEQRRAAELQAGMESINRFRSLKPSGRIALGLAAEERSFNRLPQLRLANGDRLVVPVRPDFVHVFGAVNVETSSLWHMGMTTEKYLRQAGVKPDADLDNIFVIRADGSVAGRNSSSNWFSAGVNNLEIMPGDSIVVPEKLDKETAWSRFTVGLREWSQILANFGLGAAAIKTLK